MRCLTRKIRLQCSYIEELPQNVNVNFNGNFPEIFQESFFFYAKS